MKGAEFVKLSRDILARGDCLRFKVKGMSMYPFIKSGQIIYIKQAKISEIAYADIIYYHGSDNKMIVHRVIKRAKQNGRTALLTKGDFALFRNEYVYPECILGKVVAIEKDNKILKIDEGVSRIVNILYAGILPFSRWIYLLVSKAIRCFQPAAGGKIALRNEDTLLSFCSQINLDASRKNLLEKFLKSDLDWKYIVQRAQEEGIDALIYYQLRELKFDKYMPTGRLAVLEREYYINSAKNAIIGRQAKKIINAFCENKIKAIILKGLFLAERVYPNIALRPMTDIDILIKKEDLVKANRVLNSLGCLSPANYQNILGDLPITPINSLVYKAHNLSALPVHLHWHLVNSTWPLESVVANMDMARIWSYAEPVHVEGINAFTLSAEHQLLYLTLHSFNHSFDRLILLSDILEFLRCYQDRINWPIVIEEAIRFNLSYVLYYSLFVVSRRLGYDIPELKRLKPVKISWLEKIVSARLAKKSGGHLATYAIYFFRQEGLRGKLKFISRTFFPAAQVMANNFNLPSSAIKARHYYRRIMNNIVPVLYKKHY